MTSGAGNVGGGRVSVGGGIVAVDGAGVLPQLMVNRMSVTNAINFICIVKLPEFMELSPTHFLAILRRAIQ